MISHRPLVVALEGIDGSGKSTVAKMLTDRPDLQVLTWTQPETMPDAPLRDTAQHLQTLSLQADRLGDHLLKLTIMYLQACLYAPMEEFFSRTFAPNVILTDRHPLITAPVYLPIYFRMIKQTTRLELAADSYERLVDQAPQALAGVERWASAQARRSQRRGDLRTLATDLRQFANLSPDQLAQTLCERLRTTTPHMVLYLDVHPREAARRIQNRSPVHELHESESLCQHLHHQYLRTFKIHPHIRVHQLDVNHHAPNETITQIAQLVPGLERPVASSVVTPW